MTKTRNNRKPNFRQTKRKRGGGVGNSTHKSAPFNTATLAEAAKQRQKKAEQEEAAQKKKQSAMYQSFAADAEKKKQKEAKQKEEEDAKQKAKEEAAKARNARNKLAKLQKKQKNNSLGSAVSQIESQSSSLADANEAPLESESPSLSSAAANELPPVPSPSLSAAAANELPPVPPPKSKSLSLSAAAANELPPVPPPKSLSSADSNEPDHLTGRQKTPARKKKRELQLKSKPKRELEAKFKELVEELKPIKSTCILVKDVFHIDKETQDPAERIFQVISCKCFFILGRVSYILEEMKYKFMLVLKGTRAMLLAAKKRDDIVKRLKPKPGYLLSDNQLFKTVDIDATIQLREGDETDDSIEERRLLANEIFELIKDFIGADKISILQPALETPVEAKVVKISYIKPKGGFIPISDLGFSQIKHDYYTVFQETIVEEHKLHYIFPSINDQEIEKEAFLEKFKKEWDDGDHSDKSKFNIKRFTDNLNKIRQLLDKDHTP